MVRRGWVSSCPGTGLLMWFIPDEPDRRMYLWVPLVVVVLGCTLGGKSLFTCIYFPGFLVVKLVGKGFGFVEAECFFICLNTLYGVDELMN